MNKLLLAMLILFFSFALSQADHLILENGDQLSGAVTVSGETIKIKPTWSEAFVVPRSKIKKIVYNRPVRPRKLEEISSDEIKRLIKTSPGKEGYPQAGSIWLLERNDVKINRDGSWTSTQHELIHILKERGEEEANRTLSFYRHMETIEVVVARSIKADGSVHYLKDDSIKTTAAYSSYPLYDRKDIIQFTIPEVKEGDFIEILTRKTTKKVDLLYLPDCSFYFRGSDPSLHMEVSFSQYETKNLQQNFPFRYQLFNFTEGDTPEILLQTNNQEFSFLVKTGPSKELIWEANRPPFKDIVPRLSATLTMSYDQISREVLHRLKKGAVTGPLVDKLLQDLKVEEATPLETAKIINRFVAFKIKMTNVPFYITDLHPTHPDIILKEKYGSKVDRLVLLYTLLEAAGVQADFVFVKYRNTGRMDRETPTIFDFDTLILEVKTDAGVDYLVNPSEFRPFGLLPVGMQGALAMRLTHSGGEFFTLPGEENFNDLTKLDISMELSEKGQLVVHQKEEYYDNETNGLRSSFKSKKPEERERSIRYAIEGEMKNSTLTKLDIPDLNVLDRQLIIEFEYQAEKFADTPGDGRYLIFKLPFVNINTSMVGKKTRIYDLYLPFKSHIKRQYQLKIPAGYHVHHLPSSKVQNNQMLDYQRDLRVDEKTHLIHFEEKLTLGGGTLPQGKYEQFRSEMNDIASLYREWIVLKRNEETKKDEKKEK